MCVLLMGDAFLCKIRRFGEKNEGLRLRGFSAVDERVYRKADGPPKSGWGGKGNWYWADEWCGLEARGGEGQGRGYSAGGGLSSNV